MKRRSRNFLNVICCGVLLFAFYLNFFKREQHESFTLSKSVNQEKKTAAPTLESKQVVPTKNLLATTK